MCPNCKTLMLIALELDGIEIDFCPACGGVWLDSGELEMIAARAGADASTLAPSPPSADHPARAHASRKMKCPRCARRLRPALIGRDPASVEIDVCPMAHGIWLDRGELRQIIQNASDADAAVSALARTLGDILRYEHASTTQGDPR